MLAKVRDAITMRRARMRRMSAAQPHRLGLGELTARRVINDALAMLRQSFVRIAGVAIIFFALPALITARVAEAIAGFVGDTDPLVIATAIIALFAAAALRVLAPIAFAGFLDRAVAQEYLHGVHSPLIDVMRGLPWKRLIAADLIVTFVVGIGLSLFVVPGLVLYGLLGMIGPVVVQERFGVRDSFRRTTQLARLAPGLVTLLVVVPFAFEEILHSMIFETLHSAGIGVQVLVEWVIAIVIGGMLGLLEVALATELMARNPLSEADVQDAPLLDDGQPPAV
jgi:hypothetical protein